MATVHIIGAGIAGLAAATKLAAAHVPVKLYEASASAGGRCRSSSHAALGTFDHGLHIFSGAARELQAFIRRIESRDQFVRIDGAHVTDGRTGEHWRLSPRHPIMAAPLVDHVQLIGSIVLASDAPVEQAVSPLSPLQDAALVPLSRLALTQPAHAASTRQLQRLLRRQLRRGGRSFFMAKDSLQQALITPALSMLEYLGGSVYFGQSLKSYDPARRELNFARKKLVLEPDDVVIIATPAHAAKALLPGLTVPTAQHCAITLHYRAEHAEPVGSVRILTNAPCDLLRYDAGVIRAQLRLADHAWHSDEAALAARVWQQIQKLHPELAMGEWAIWREKRAGHVPLKHKLPAPDLPPRCLLAGDWLDATRPATLNSAARSGHQAARAALALLGKKAPREQAAPGKNF